MCKPNTVATEWRKRQLVYSLSVLSYMLYQLLEYAEQTWTQNISLGQAGPEAVCIVCFISKTYVLAPCSRVLLEKLTGFVASQGTPCIYGIPKFITVLTSAHHLSLSWAPSHFLKIPLNIILPSMSESPQWSFFFQASTPKPCAHFSPPPYVPHAQPISFFLILPPIQYWVRSTDH
jgi:hypothetical protein